MFPLLSMSVLGPAAIFIFNSSNFIVGDVTLVGCGGGKYSKSTIGNNPSIAVIGAGSSKLNQCNNSQIMGVNITNSRGSGIIVSAALGTM